MRNILPKWSRLHPVTGSTVNGINITGYTLVINNIHYRKTWLKALE